MRVREEGAKGGDGYESVKFGEECGGNKFKNNSGGRK